MAVDVVFVCRWGWLARCRLEALSRGDCGGECSSTLPFSFFSSGWVWLSHSRRLSIIPSVPRPPYLPILAPQRPTPTPSLSRPRPRPRRNTSARRITPAPVPTVFGFKLLYLDLDGGASRWSGLSGWTVHADFSIFACCGAGTVRFCAGLVCVDW